MEQSPPWRHNATELAGRIRKREFRCVDATVSVLDRIAAVNPRVNAVVDVMADEALAAAEAADLALDQGKTAGPLHGVPVTVKINVDTQGRPTTDGVAARANAVAESDSPLVAHLRKAGAIIVGRSNAPAFSMRWFTGNALHGITRNPFDADVTPGGSSGGAAAAVALGMGAIAQGNDYGGSVRYPAWACGVVGLRPTVGRIPSFKASSPDRIPSFQMMAVQGPITRTVADARLALRVMMERSALDPDWTPAPLEHADLHDIPLRAAFVKRHPAFDVDPTVSEAVEMAAGWLREAGWEVDEVSGPPDFEEAAALWRQLAMDDLRRGVAPAIEAYGDEAVKASLRGFMHGLTPADRDQTFNALTRRYAIGREWSLFHERHPVLLMPNAWQRQFPAEADQVGDEAFQSVLRACSPMLANALLGLPGLAVPTGMDSNLPVGVQICVARFREDIAFRAGEIIERAANFSALDHLAPPIPAE